MRASNIELFPHQKEALDEMKKFYKSTKNQYSGLVVVPTGGGKTFIAVNWILEEIKKRNVKILWLAQSFELLNQAARTFEENSLLCNKELNIKVISSHKYHSNISEISEIDSIIIMTTQTAIREINKENNRLVNLKNERDNGLIIVIDEAHHVPAYGCRNLLMKLKDIVPDLWILGLTATPTYTKVNKRGWLWKIFNGGVIYEVEKKLLQQQHILAKENIIKKKTPMKIDVSDENFNKLVKLNKDVPEDIIEKIASNVERNNFLVNEYLKNKDFYGKTIIFVDRWFQCLYIRDKLNENGVISEAIFYQNDIDTKMKGKEGNSNKEIIDKFRNNEIQVLINVKMFTEGADVPDVKTAFITRDTTSHILLYQMIGRALRGRRAGGKKDTANIVLFGDNWDKTIAWAEPERDGDVEDKRIKQMAAPIDKISLGLMEQLIKSINYNSINIPKYITSIPIGWYEVEYVSFKYEEDEKIEVIRDIVLVYEGQKEEYDNLIICKMEDLNEKWAFEELDFAFVEKEVNEIIKTYLPKISYVTEKEISGNIIKILRHIAQNNTEPNYFEVSNRSEYNIETIVENVIDLKPKMQFKVLMDEYMRPGNIWCNLYSKFYYFKSAVDMYINKVLFNISDEYYEELEKELEIDEVISEAEQKEQIKAVKFRDNNTCLCCGLTSKETKLTTDSIISEKIIRNQKMNNLQTLCTRCCTINKENKINFTRNVSIVLKPKAFNGVDFDKQNMKNIQKIKAAIKTSINIFYGCGAIYDINLSRRKNSQYYSIWKIILYEGNNLYYIKSKKTELLKYIREEVHQDHVLNVEIGII